MLNNIKFNLPSGYDAQQLISSLADQYTVKKDLYHSEIIRFYDTFDWRLFNKSLVLYESRGRLFLRELNKNEIIHSIEISSPPIFIWEFPNSELKDQLAPIIDVRALLRLFEVQSRSIHYRILNQDEKTVLRLSNEEIRFSRTRNAPRFASQLWLLPVKGYPKYYREIAKRFEEEGLRISKEDTIYFKGLEAVHKKPGSYSTKLDIQLDPDMRADHATRSILKYLSRTIRINEAEIEKDIDTEFVHDFRVAIRRTRSALGQIRYVFPSNITNRFKKDFFFIFKLSNELRDLDVYLLQEDRYKMRLPPSLRDDINPLFDYLRKKRLKALRRLVSGLKSNKYAKILNDWEAFLNKPQTASPTATNAEVRIIDLARSRIYKKYRNVVKSGALIEEDIDDRRLHVLRIHCKKLRYLMEFFCSLFPPKKIDTLIKQLKKLQDNLGLFNDLRVQEQYLLNITKELPVDEGQLNKTSMAIGGLVNTLSKEKNMIKDAFAGTFKDFSSPENKVLFHELFASQTPESYNNEDIGHIQQ
jgi:CHAD domain-containing protein